MLTADLVRPRLRTRGDQLTIELLPDNPFWRRTAADLIDLFRRQAGSSLSQWGRALEAYEGSRTDYSLLRGLAKVLEDAARFTPLPTGHDPAVIRARLFAQGPVFRQPDLFHPHSRDQIIAYAAEQLGLTSAAIEAALFADRPAEYVMTDSGPEWTPEALIARYNLELARGVLYWCSQMRVTIQDSYKDFWRYLKFFKLMFDAAPRPAGGYSVTLDGPISPFVKATTRYGRQFAAFLPALFLCDRWQLTADVRPPQSQMQLTYRLDQDSPLRTHFKHSGLYDSRLEADFAADFESKFGGERGHWALTREDEVLLLGDTVMIPDFAATHKGDGRRALIEIVGYWTPEYLNRKLEKVRAAQRHNLILLVYEGVNLTPDRLMHVPGEVLYFPNKPVLKEVMTAIERCAE